MMLDVCLARARIVVFEFISSIFLYFDLPFGPEFGVQHRLTQYVVGFACPQGVELVDIARMAVANGNDVAIGGKL